MWFWEARKPGDDMGNLNPEGRAMRAMVQDMRDLTVAKKFGEVGEKWYNLIRRLSPSP